MKIQLKKFILCLSVFCAGLCLGSDMYHASALSDFRSSPRLSVSGEIFTAKGKFNFIVSDKKLVLDSSRKYRLTGSFRTASGSSPKKIYFGYIPYDKTDRQIQTPSVCTVDNSETVLAADARAGSRSVQVKDASKWLKQTKFGYLALNINQDFSDLPNRRINRIAPDGVRKSGEIWTVQLTQPLKRNYAEGTAVRQHTDGDNYIYNVKSISDAGKEWTDRTGYIKHRHTNKISGLCQWPGTAYLKVFILIVGGKDDTAVEFKNISVNRAE